MQNISPPPVLTNLYAHTRPAALQWCVSCVNTTRSYCAINIENVTKQSHQKATQLFPVTTFTGSVAEHYYVTAVISRDIELQAND